MDRGIGLMEGAPAAPAFAKHETSVHHGERRHSFRVPLEGRASIWHRNQLLGHYSLRDLSIGGCSLQGAAPCSRGEHVELILHLPERPALWVTAEVRRTEGDLVGVAFERTPPRIEDRLQDVVVEVYTRMHTASEHFALVVEPRAQVRQGIVQRLSALGERAVGVATPLDAVQLLLEQGDRVHSVFIGPQRPEIPSYEMVEFVARNYPRAHRVLMGDAHEVAEAWLAEATGEVHALLETPVNEERLRRLVHRIASLPPEALS